MHAWRLLWINVGTSILRGIHFPSALWLVFVPNWNSSPGEMDVWRPLGVNFGTSFFLEFLEPPDEAYRSVIRTLLAVVSPSGRTWESFTSWNWLYIL